MNYSELKNILEEKGLKVTPQRIAVLEALYGLKNHPSADEVRKIIQEKYPNIALGTLYNILDTLCEHNIIRKVKTENDFMRYDIEMDKHHHIYCDECDYIENYYDEELDKMLVDYFNRKGIPNFNIKEINLQIVGSYKDHVKPNKND